MKDRLFDWPTVWRHIVLGAVPFICVVYLYEHFLNEWTLGAMIVVLAAVLPFIAIGWLGYQHWKHASKKSSSRHG
jgi:hypothetical protein